MATDNATPANGTILEVHGLKKSFGPKQVLMGVDLKVEKAEVLTILGPNGCGKSTFLRCLNLLEQYQEGRVRLNGKQVSEGRPEEHQASAQEKDQAQHLRQHVGMVFQRFNLFPHMTVIQNVMAGPKH